ncbi:unnamed protein product [Mytilus coruscus]|uniref:Uncharacterized protein n=1 Tax=Mytilus coruscus TaxID=42192 RepID=A0A6J8ALR3_MYTCO|nr:unnamed protein product [Mytilus coruscus]
MEKLTGKWIERHEKGPDVLKYFLDYKSDLIKSCMSDEIRSKCGLGYPPIPIRLQYQNTVIYLKSLANLNMPCGRGKKPHKATQKRKGKANKSNETALTYLDDHDQPQVPPPRPPDGGYIIYFLKNCDNKVSKCCGYKGNLKHEGQITQPPGDVVVVSRGRREYFKDGTKLYGEINNIYFHLSEQFIKSK